MSLVLFFSSPLPLPPQFILLEPSNSIWATCLSFSQSLWHNPDAVSLSAVFSTHPRSVPGCFRICALIQKKKMHSLCFEKNSKKKKGRDEKMEKSSQWKCCFDLPSCAYDREIRVPLCISFVLSFSLSFSSCVFHAMALPVPSLIPSGLCLLGVHFPFKEPFLSVLTPLFENELNRTYRAACHLIFPGKENYVLRTQQ